MSNGRMVPKKIRDLSSEEFLAMLIMDAIQNGQISNNTTLHPNGDGFKVESIVSFGSRDGKPGMSLRVGPEAIFKVHVTHESGRLPNISDLGDGEE